jgi:hypothetical protein
MEQQKDTEIKDQEKKDDEIKDQETKDAEILMRQTTYVLEECREMLKTKTLEQCIKDFLGIVEKKDERGSTNQKIFRSIREHF